MLQRIEIIHKTKHQNDFLKIFDWISVRIDDFEDYLYNSERNNH